MWISPYIGPPSHVTRCFPPSLPHVRLSAAGAHRGKVSVGPFTHSLVVIDLYSLGGTRGLTPVTYLHAFNACLSVIVWSLAENSRGRFQQRCRRTEKQDPPPRRRSGHTAHVLSSNFIRESRVCRIWRCWRRYWGWWGEGRELVPARTCSSVYGEGGVIFFVSEVVLTWGTLVVLVLLPLPGPPLPYLPPSIPHSPIPTLTIAITIRPRAGFK